VSIGDHYGLRSLSVLNVSTQSSAAYLQIRYEFGHESHQLAFLVHHKSERRRTHDVTVVRSAKLGSQDLNCRFSPPLLAPLAFALQLHAPPSFTTIEDYSKLCSSFPYSGHSHFLFCFVNASYATHLIFNLQERTRPIMPVYNSKLQSKEKKK
jgi:hypothetical protein